MSESCVLVGCPSKHTEVHYVGTGFQTTCPTCGTSVIARTLVVSPDFRRDPKVIEGFRAHIQAEVLQDESRFYTAVTGIK